MSLDPEDLTRALVRIPSITPDAKAVVDHAAEVLAALGFACTPLPFSAPDTPDVDNLFARIGTGAPHLAFAGHLDVVPTGPEANWGHPPFGGEADGGHLYGRGAIDMKSGVACFIAAVSEYLSGKEDFQGSISLILTGDEEGPAVNGTVKMLDWMRETGNLPNHCIVGEPSSLETPGDQIKVGRRGSISGRLTAIGKQGHVAYPHLAANPIPLLARMIEAIEAEPLDAGTDRFQPSNLEFTDISTGNTAGNVIPGTARAAFNIRYNVTQTPNTLKAALIRRIARVAAKDSFRLDLDPPAGEPFLTEDETLLATVSGAIRDITGADPDLSTGGGTSDARFIKAVCPVVEVGLAGKTMHEVDERVPVADLHRQTAIYRRILERYFNG